MSRDLPPREGDFSEYEDEYGDEYGYEATDRSALAALFAAARADGADGTEYAGDDRAAARRAEADAVAAFRSARDAGAHRGVRTRRRDDWRPRAAGRRLAWRAAVGAALAGLTVGGVAVAVGGVVGDGGSGGAGTAQATTGPEEPGPDAGSSSGSRREPDSVRSPQPEEPADGERTPGEERPGGPSTPPGSEESVLALCRTWGGPEGASRNGQSGGAGAGAGQGEDGGKSSASVARQRLVEAAGGEDAVAAYCARLLEQAAAGDGEGQAETESSAGSRPDSSGAAASGAERASRGSREPRSMAYGTDGAPRAELPAQQQSELHAQPQAAGVLSHQAHTAPATTPVGPTT